VIKEIVVVNKIVEANKAIVIDRANLAKEADKANLNEVSKSLTNNSIADFIKYLSRLSS
jgi:hypothetical protein